MPLPLPQQCEATVALSQRLDGHGDQRLAGIGAWLYVVTIMLNFMNAGPRSRGSTLGESLLGSTSSTGASWSTS
eukprot:1799350-Heterocapsa_arctica.AAC.1